MALKPYLPKSLFWRTVLIVVAPIVILQAVAAYLIVQRHFDGVTRQMTGGVALELSYLVDFVENAASVTDAELALVRASRTLNFPIELREDEALRRDARPLFFDVLGRAVEEELQRELRRPMTIEFDTDAKTVLVEVETARGVVSALLPRRRLIASNPHLLLTWMVGTAIGLIAISVLYLRNQIRPIRALADAAEAFGKGRSVPLSPAGAEEVRRAAGAFLDMRERIERQMEQRTRMLSGVSHDMRTPLTRMKLALEMMDDAPELDDLRHDIADLEHILEEFLAYARGDQGEAFCEVDVSTLAQDVVSEARRKGGDVALVTTPAAPDQDDALPARLNIRANAIKRCLHNLLDNAVSYGKRATLSLSVQPAFIEFAVEDDGPGIPPERRDEAFRPFNRLDEARNRDNPGGVGLGLALALDAVRGHGGEIVLGESDSLGGLRAVARLPR